MLKSSLENSFKRVTEFNAFIDPRSPDGIKVYQISDDPKGANLIYPDFPSFLADGRRFVFNGSQGPMIGNLDDLSVRKLFDDDRRPEILISPSGRFIVWIEKNKDQPDRFIIKRLDAQSFRVETVYSAEGLLPGTSIPAGRFGVLTFSSDGRRVAGTLWLGDGTKKDAPFGIVSIDLETGAACLVAEDRDFINTHLRYCPSTEEEASHDLLVQMNHGSHHDETGKCTCHLGPPAEGGVDIHVVRDDGSDWRDLPWGRDGKESCIGHQIWRGQGRSAVTITLQNMDTSYGWADGTRQEVVAGWPVKADKDKPHIGRLHRGAQRVLLSKGFRHGRFCHLSGDASGLKFVFDTFPIFDGMRAGMQIYIGSASDEASALKFRYILNTGITFKIANDYHAHPILSPDGRVLLLNSNITGAPQAYMVTGFE